MKKTAFYYHNYDTKYGEITIVSNGKAIVKIGRDIKILPTYTKQKDALTDDMAKQLNEYFRGLRDKFDISFNYVGTEFQIKVWTALYNIPYGETRTYKQIAEFIGSPKAYRAVGMACNKNPLWIVIPCHRVVGSSGSLTGYAGGLDMKEKLLELEKVDS
ncbi:MAG: methylated-DNA--[protein]-cysteine S-methyltransferase [Oscillospiraceae bacterium]|jgi:methylated-DNA-[protein]-cysteine S-methyltransferase|nr:methylated-DNA--[protein]-cysteine S-methyltransferase [Oscillospiraceae bacterium]